VHFLGAVSRQQIVQVERQRRIVDSLPGPVARGQSDVAPGGVRRDLIEKKIETAAAVSRVRVNRVDPVGRQGAHQNVTAHDGREVVIDHAVVEQIP
jgi:hypothetical protein